MKKNTYEGPEQEKEREDDGRVIADMSGVPRGLLGSLRDRPERRNPADDRQVKAGQEGPADSWQVKAGQEGPADSRQVRARQESSADDLRNRSEWESSGEEAAENPRPWEDTSLSRKERWIYALGALKASLLIGGAYIVGLGAVILLLILFWD